MSDEFTIGTTFSKQYLKEAIKNDATADREDTNAEKKIYSIMHMNEVLKRYPYGPQIGIGIGANALSDTTKLYGLLAKSARKDERPGSYQLPYTLAEFGWGGACLIFLIFIVILVCLRKMNREETDPYWRGIHKGLAGFTFLMLFSATYRLSWYADTLIPLFYWLMYAAVYARESARKIFSGSANI